MNFFLNPDIPEVVQKAAILCFNLHGSKKRKSGFNEFYYNHPARAAQMFMNMCASTGLSNEEQTTITAATLLHDILEDTTVDFFILSSVIGDQIANVVAEVTDDPFLSTANKKRRQLAKVSGMSIMARYVKLLDRIDNVLDLFHDQPIEWDVARCQGYFTHSRALILSLAPTCQALADVVLPLFELDFYHRPSRTRAPTIPKDKTVDDVLDAFYLQYDESDKKKFELVMQAASAAAIQQLENTKSLDKDVLQELINFKVQIPCIDVPLVLDHEPHKVIGSVDPSVFYKFNYTSKEMADPNLPEISNNGIRQFTITTRFYDDAFPSEVVKEGASESAVPTQPIDIPTSRSSPPPPSSSSSSSPVTSVAPESPAPSPPAQEEQRGDRSVSGKLRGEGQRR
jgi:hypothetical protein